MWTSEEECFSAFDIDKDEKLNFDEFLTLCKSLFQNEDGVPYTYDEDSYRSVFDVFDQNHDQFVDRNEFELMWDRWIKTILIPKCALLIVDVQNDFISGSLKLVNCKELPKDGDVVTPINKLLETIPFDIVAYSLDWHPDDHISFIENVHARKLDITSPTPSKDVKVFDTVVFEGPPIMEQKLWPKHAVQNTWGSELHKDLKIVEGALKIYKGTDANVDSYSAFWDNVKNNESPLREELKMRKITDLFVCGLAYDYCVGTTTLDALRAGFRTVLIDDCTAGLAFDAIDKVKAGVISKHGVVINSDKVLAMVGGKDRRPELGFKLAMDTRVDMS